MGSGHEDGLRRRIRALLARQLGLDAEEVRPESHLVHDLGVDSLDAADLVLALEETFGLEVPDADLAKLQTLGDVERYVTARAAG